MVFLIMSLVMTASIQDTQPEIRDTGTKEGEWYFTANSSILNIFYSKDDDVVGTIVLHTDISLSYISFSARLPDQRLL